MKNALSYLLGQIVDNADAVKIDEQEDNSRTLYIVHVHPDDIGKVIGKHGRIIRAIRDVIKLIAAKENRYVDVVLAEEAAPQE